VSAPSEPRSLILETSGRAGQVALAEGDVLRAVRRLDEARRHARDLAPAVAELLASQGWQPRDIHAVIISRGPGSYTGLRVGIMSAKAFAYATGCALIALDTFAVIAAQTPPEVSIVDVLADAQQGRLYVQRFALSGAGAPIPVTPLAILPSADWLAARDPATWVSGPGLRGQHLPQGIPTVEAARWDPQAETLMRLGLIRYREGTRDDLWGLEPLYLRPSAAEEQWRGRDSS
jgi:tRNA threonylcarbamoyladenosine biosynthesis protein TsaB